MWKEIVFKLAHVACSQHARSYQDQGSRPGTRTGLAAGRAGDDVLHTPIFELALCKTQHNIEPAWNLGSDGGYATHLHRTMCSGPEGQLLVARADLLPPGRPRINIRTRKPPITSLDGELSNHSTPTPPTRPRPKRTQLTKQTTSRAPIPILHGRLETSHIKTQEERVAASSLTLYQRSALGPQPRWRRP